MSAVAVHLVKRGFDVTQQLASRAPNKDGETFHIPAWGAALLIVTLITYFIVMSAIQYTYGTVVSTLAMIETPSATAFKIDSPKSEDVDAPLLDQKSPDSIEDTGSEILLVKAKPITGKIFRTMKHLRAQAGPWARFRGAHVGIIYGVIHQLLFAGLSHIFPFYKLFFAGVVSTVVLCRLQMTWVHVIISLPSTKSWYRRMPNCKSTKNIIIPTLLCAIAEQAVLHITTTLFNSFNRPLHAQDPEEFYHKAMEYSSEVFPYLLLVIAVGLVANFLIVLPATVTLTRVEASMLPEEHESIVPFDRTFGGQVQPEILGGSGAVSMSEAWKTFDWAARFRLVKLYFKIALIELTASVGFVLILSTELMLVLKNTAKH